MSGHRPRDRERQRRNEVMKEIDEARQDIQDRGGETLYSRKISGTKPIISNKTLLDIRDLLATTVSQGTGSNAALPPSFHGTYGKTGTSQNFRDAWFIGFADKLVVGIWLGNDNEEPMKSISGGGAPAMIWRDFMLRTRD